MKQRNLIQILLALLVLSGICVIWLYATGRETEEEQAVEEIAITDISVGEVQAVMLKNDSGSVGLLNVASGIVVDGEATDKYSQDKLKLLVYSLAHLPAVRVVGDGELAEFGLDKPRAQTSLLLADRTIRMQLGRQNPLSGEYYLKTDESDAVYMVEADVGEQMLQSVLDLRELAMYPTLDEETLGFLSQISMENDDGKIVLVQLESDTISSFYAMAEPVAVALNWEKVDTLILNPLRQLNPQRFVSEDVPLSSYGLDAPDCVLTLVLDGKTYRCGFAQKDPDTWYCANLEGTLVSEVDGETVSFLKTNFFDLIGESIYSKSIADLSRIGVKYNNKQNAVTIEGEGSALTATVGSWQMDSQETLAFYDKIDSIPAAALLQGDEAIEPDAMLTIMITMRDGTEDILEFHPISERQCAVFINGVAEFSTYTTVVTELMAAFDALDQGTSE